MLLVYAASVSKTVPIQVSGRSLSMLVMLLRVVAMAA